MKTCIRLITSLRLTVACLIAAIILVFIGTLAQVELGLHATQARYFQSVFVYWTPERTQWRIPVWPGGWLLGGVLLVNLIAAHLQRFEWSWRKSGIVLIHFGLIVLLIGQFFTEIFQVESFMVIENQGRKNFSEDARKHELAIVDVTDPLHSTTVAIPETFLSSKGEIKDPQLPFTLRVKEFYRNSTPVLFDSQANGKRFAANQGFGQRMGLEERATTAKMNDENKPAALVEVIAANQPLGEWSVSTWLTKNGYKDRLRDFQIERGMPMDSLADQPQQFTHAGRTYTISLRPVRYYKSYSIELIQFTHARYQGTDIPKDYSSRIHLRNERTQEEREVLISMNNPLRYGGETYYQAGFLEKDAGTILQVVRNPAWLAPYSSCIVVGLGLLIHFSIHFFKFLKESPSRRTAPVKRGDVPSSVPSPLEDSSTAVGVGGVLSPKRGIPSETKFSWLLAAAFAMWILFSLRPTKNLTEFKLDEFGRLPILANGRIQPLDSFARNTLLSIHGTQTVRPATHDPSQTRVLSAREWLLEVMADAKKADNRRIFRIESLDLRNLLGAQEGRLGQLAYTELAPKRDQILKEARQLLKIEEEKGREPQLRNAYEKDLMHLYQGMIIYDRLKNAIQPADSRDFQGELKVFRETIPPALTAVQEHQAGNLAIATNGSIALLSLFMNRYQNMTLWGLPMLAPPLEVDSNREGWSNIGTNLLLAMRSGRFHPAIDYYAAIATSWRADKPADFNKAVSDYQGWLVQRGLGSEMSKSKAEFLFNHLEPFYKATLMYVAALLLGAAFWLNFSPWLRKSAYSLVILAFALHTIGLIFRMWLEGRPPVTNLYSSAVFVGWGAVFLGIILERLYPEGIGLVTASCVGFMTLIIAHNLAGGGDTLEMMRAVLDTNVWLATHVVIINIGYAATSLAGFLGIIYIARGIFTRSLSQPRAKRLARMVYGTVCFATLFTFVGTVLGGLWADQSWGRFWGWDPKENGALLIVLANATLLHMRWGGMIRERGMMSAAIFGNIVTAWSWFGTNMLGVGLHSYGFMDKGFQWLVLFVASQGVFMLLALTPLRHWRSLLSESTDAAKTVPPDESATGGI
ncbi:MAG: cytochrome c biogenesis protein CcsA [Verrucomicrobiales bacterium]|nr:cytochrome c biogenesis protein CcsA [Verrucomicrobiales bacterium]